MRRLTVRSLTAATAVVFLGLTLIEPAMADDSINSGAWSGSALNPIQETGGGAISVSGVFTRNPVRTIEIRVSVVPVEGGCSVGSVVLSEGPSQERPFNAAFSIPCNGRYRVTAVAQTTRNSPVLPSDAATLDRTVDVAVPPGSVAGVTATEGTGRVITVRWSALEPRPPDFSGYTVERRLPDGTVESFTLGDVTSYEDGNPPPGGGTTTYRVFARRAAPGGEVRSTSPGEATVEISAAPADPDDPGDPTGPTGPTGPDGPDGPGGPATPGNPSNPSGPSGPSDAGGSAGSGGAGGTVNGGAGRPSPAIRVPRVGTPSRNFFPPLLSPPSPEDTGFSEELPFEEREPGEEDAVLPDDLASGPFEATPGRGLVIPMATGLVLALWAFHLRFLARASRPEYLDDDDDDRVEVILY